MRYKILLNRAFTSRLSSKLSCNSRNLSTNTSFLKVSPEIQDAINSKKPVVALETTIYTHGFPYPENIALSSRLESIVRTNGGIPATIGVLHGVARVGFDPEDLIELLSSTGNVDTIKLSRRDLGYICGLGISGRKLNGGTTIAATMLLAHLAGIKVFATGGLGGVHQNGQVSMDISADLTELGRTPVALISSGCKSFLDIPRTLEYLETQGVGVSTFADGRTGDINFPAFWTRDSGVSSPSVVNDEKEAAAIILAQMSLPLSSGLFFANPIPIEYSLSKSEMDIAMAAAIQEAKQLGVSGSKNTPFILKRIKEMTGGKTITANRALVEANVLRGTKVAVELANLERKFEGVFGVDHPMPAESAIGQIRYANPLHIERAKMPRFSGSSIPPIDIDNSIQLSSNHKMADIVVAGSLAIDLSCNYTPQCHQQFNDQVSTPMLETSNPATISQSLGGVGQNIATALHYLDITVRLCSAVGDDIAGRTALNVLSERNMLIDGVMVKPSGSRTAQFVAFNDSQKQLVMAMADMTILESAVSELPAHWKTQLHYHPPKWLILDANWDPTTLSAWASMAKNLGVKIAYEPVSVEKSTRIFDPRISPTQKLAHKSKPAHEIDLATPNDLELKSMYNTLRDTFVSSRKNQRLSSEQEIIKAKLTTLTNTALVERLIPQMAMELLPFIPCILTKLGPEGVLMTQLLYPEDPKLSDPAAAPYILSHFDSLVTNPEYCDERPSRVVAGVYMRLFSAAEYVPEDQIVSVNGVGDTFLGVIMAGLTKENAKPIEDLIGIAQKGAVMTLKSVESVSPEIASLRSLL